MACVSARSKRRRNPIGATVANIPDDVAEQILLRLPVKSILRFRSVRSWRAMVADQRFVRLQLHHSTAARPPSMIVMPCWSVTDQRMGTISFFHYQGHGAAAELAHEEALPLELAHEEALPLGVAADWNLPLHCNGLVMVSSEMYSSDQIIVCNPATRELAELPVGTPDLFGIQKVGLGADPLTGEVKVVRCFIRHCDYTKTDYSVGCEVFPLGGGSGAWRPVADSPYLVMPSPSPCILGAIYWNAALPSPPPPAGSGTARGILRFDVRAEEFSLFPIPPCMQAAPEDVEGFGPALTELAGKLCYVHKHVSDAGVAAAQLWTASAADDDGAARWSMHCTVELYHPALAVRPFAVDYQGGIFLNANFPCIFRYDTERQVLEREVGMNQEMTYFRASNRLHYRFYGGRWMHHVVPYRESLLTIRAK
uniref:F-box domain-containing protein n=1 Tax=Oryza brachyantha TaxID=4533 RepID=J3MBP1_ORYBR